MSWTRWGAIAFIFTLLPVDAVLVAQNPGATARGMRRGQQRIKAIYLRDFRQALPKFEATVKALESALGSEKPKLAKTGKELEKQTEVFLRYVKHITEEHPSFKPEDLVKYSNVELGWEALTSAETLVPILPRIAALENSAVVDLNYWQLLYALEGELLRLKWMSSKLK
jgi:hypothetical protein